MFFNLFKRNKNNDCIDMNINAEIESTDFKKNVRIQFNWLKEKGWLLNNFDISKKNILIMDDKENVVSSVIDELTSLENYSTFNIDNYNIICLHSKEAGFHALEILEHAPDIEIDYALLDIILGGKQKINDHIIMLDGVDVAIKIWEKFPQAEILFITGCLIEDTSDKMHFKTKFDNYTQDDLNNYILSKDLGFDEGLKVLIKFFNVF